MGNTFIDYNLDSIMGPGETNFTNVVMSAAPGNYVSAVTDLGYRIQLDTNATSNVSPVNPYPHSLNVVPQNRSVTTAGLGQVQGFYDFALQPIPNIHDLEVYMYSAIARRGFNTAVRIRVTNAGTLTESPFLSLSFPIDWVPLVTYPLGNINGNLITWQDTALAPFDHHDFYVQFYIPAFVPLNQSFSYTAWVGAANDVTPPNNTYTINDHVRGGYDPNDKSCDTPELLPGYDPEQEIIYTVRFQNTGNDTAFTVAIRDTLSTNLRANSVRVVNSSHEQMDMYFLDNSRALSFVFPNINLVDSFTNEPLSHGFVQYAVKPQPNLPVGATILNTASIYFDYNSAVRTNTVVTNLNIVSVPQFASNGPLNIYPNPTSGHIQIEAPEDVPDGSHIVVTGLMGETLLRQPMTGNSGELSLDALPAGLYTVAITSQSRILYRSLVVKQ